MRAISDRLSSATGLTVDVRAAASPLDAIEQLGTRKADAGILTLEEFLLAHEEYGVVPGLQVLRGKGETRYDSVILVPAKSTAKKVADLDGARFGFVDPYSVSGFLLPTQFLQKEGVKVAPLFLDSHDKALEALTNGEVAAIATYADQAAGRKDLRVLARTGTVPNEPFVFRKYLRSEQRQALVKALLEQKDLLPVAHITGFGPVDEEAYRSVHDILRAAGKTVYDIVPGGTAFRRLNQGYVFLR
jgi:phosphonate transport system substrate-binding protein